MPGKRCVLYGCSNIADHKAGVSLHSSPVRVLKNVRDKWVRFVKTHRANFNSPGDFAICSRHFEVSCFERPLHMPGSRRRLLPGSVPTIWRDGEEKPISARKRRKVSLYNFRFHCFIFVLYFQWHVLLFSLKRFFLRLCENYIMLVIQEIRLEQVRKQVKKQQVRSNEH